jgi:hypothetical protein
MMLHAAHRAEPFATAAAAQGALAMVYTVQPVPSSNLVWCNIYAAVSQLTVLRMCLHTGDAAERAWLWHHLPQGLPGGAGALRGEGAGSDGAGGEACAAGPGERLPAPAEQSGECAL